MLDDLEAVLGRHRHVLDRKFLQAQLAFQACRYRAAQIDRIAARITNGVPVGLGGGIDWLSDLYNPFLIYPIECGSLSISP